MRTILAIAIAMFVAAAGTARANDYSIGDLTVTHAVAFETAKTAHSGAAYLTVANAGDTDDRLIAVISEIYPNIMLHLSETSADGIARMQHLDGIDIPAGQTVTLAPGGMHLMFMPLQGDGFDPGESIAATLVFEKAGALELDFAVQARTGTAGGIKDSGGHPAPVAGN